MRKATTIIINLFLLMGLSFAQAPARLAPVALKSYSAISDRVSRPKPLLPALGPAGSNLKDPTYGSRILRVTDANTVPGANSNFHTTSAADHCTWDRSGRYFYITDSGGAVLPFAFDATNFRATRLASTTNSPGIGGRQIRLGGEPDFSFERDGVLIGHDIRSAGQKISEYNIATDTYTLKLDLGALGFPLRYDETTNTGPYVGYTSVSYAKPGSYGERVCVLFGGKGQDYHYLVAVFDLSNPQGSLKVLDTRNVKAGSSAANMTAIPNGVATFSTGIDLHGAEISRDGRYVLMTRAYRTPTAGVSLVVVWDTVANTFTGQSLNVDGHISLGIERAINQSGDSDPMSWRIRPLGAVNDANQLTKLVKIELPQGKPPYRADWQIGDHTSWNNISFENPTPPILSANYRYNSPTANAYDLVARPWRAWDDEILAIRTDGIESRVWRFAHHRSVVAPDEGAGAFYFWYTPRAQISRDGRFAIFTSNWEKTLGVPSRPEFGGRFRQDVFLVELEAGNVTPRPDPTPPPSPTPDPQLQADMTPPVAKIDSAIVSGGYLRLKVRVSDTNLDRIEVILNNLNIGMTKATSGSYELVYKVSSVSTYKVLVIASDKSNNQASAMVDAIKQ